LRAATISATSVGSPSARQAPSAWISALSVHSSPAISVSRSARLSTAGSTGAPSRWISPDGA